MNNRPVFLITAKLTDTIWLFLMPFIEYLQKQGMEVKVLASKGSYLPELKEAGIDVRLVPYEVSFNPLRVITMIWHAYNEIKTMAPVAVLCNDPSAGFISRIAARLAGTANIIYFCHGLPWPAHSDIKTKLLYYPIEFIARPFTDAVITINEPDYQFCLKTYKAAFKINGVGVDITAFDKASPEQAAQAKERFALPADKKTALFIGRLIKEKGVLDFLEAAQQLNASHAGKGIIFAIVGDGPLAPDVRRIINEHGLEDTVKFIGYVSDIKELLPAADIMVLPTYYIEGLPRSIQEAMACGVPVIATDIRGCNELIEDGKTGLLVPPRQPKALAEAIDRLISDNTLSQNLAQRAYDNVRENFNTTLVIEQFANVLKKLHIPS